MSCVFLTPCACCVCFVVSDSMWEKGKKGDKKREKNKERQQRCKEIISANRICLFVCASVLSPCNFSNLFLRKKMQQITLTITDGKSFVSLCFCYLLAGFFLVSLCECVCV